MIPTFDLANSLRGSHAAGGGEAWANPTASMALSNADRTAEANTTTFEATHCTHNTLNTSTGGKFYWEIQIDVLDSVSDIYLGVRRSDQSITSDVNPYNEVGSNHAIKRGESGEGIRTGGGWAASSGWGRTEHGSTAAIPPPGQILWLTLCRPGSTSSRFSRLTM